MTFGGQWLEHTLDDRFVFSNSAYNWGGEDLSFLKNISLVPNRKITLPEAIA